MTKEAQSANDEEAVSRCLSSLLIPSSLGIRISSFWCACRSDGAWLLI